MSGRALRGLRCDGAVRVILRMRINHFLRGGRWAAVAMVAIGLFAGRAAAVERTVFVDAPAKVVPGANFSVVILASTDAGQGEQVGFLQVDASNDGGKTWQPKCYRDGLGPKVRQSVDLTAGAAGSEVRLRVRVAFRGGLAGDVDYSGAAIRWKESWERWEEPPARLATIKVAGQ